MSNLDDLKAAVEKAERNTSYQIKMLGTPTTALVEEREAHRALVEELEKELRYSREIEAAARKGSQLGPIVGAQTILDQQLRIASLEASLAESRSAAFLPVGNSVDLARKHYRDSHGGENPPSNEALFLSVIERAEKAAAELADCRKVIFCEECGGQGVLWTKSWDGLSHTNRPCPTCAPLRLFLSAVRIESAEGQAKLRELHEREGEKK